MSDQPPASAAPVPTWTAAELIENLQAVFGGHLRADNAVHRGEMFHALQNLTGMYVTTNQPQLASEVRHDWAASQAMFARFQRDAYGVARFEEYLGELRKDELITDLGSSRVMTQVSSLGIRINTTSPRKTKIAAAFSLWMSVFRPVYLPKCFYPGVSQTAHIAFGASLNFWMCTMYLACYGTVALTDCHDGQTRMTRVTHDLTYRGINLSSLEMLYASLYRPN